MGGNASGTGTHDRKLPGHAANSAATCAALAFVAGLIGVIKIRKARALEQITGRGRLVAQLT